MSSRYKNICEIGKERIRRAGKKIKEELEKNCKLTDDKEYLGHTRFGTVKNPHSQSLEYIDKKTGEEKVEVINYNSSQDIYKVKPEKLDIGFRVLKCDSTNMKDVYYNPSEFTINMLTDTVDNIKEDRTPEDLLFQVMLDLGVKLSAKITETKISEKKVFNVENNYLIACFDTNVTEETITAIAKQKPYYFVMRDSSMANDSVATNFEQIFATYSPDTVRKVL